MTTRAEIEALFAEGHSYQTAARELGVPAGRLYLIRTGHAADTSGGEQPAQDLFNPPVFNPKTKQHVLDWVRERAARELQQP